MHKQSHLKFKTARGFVSFAQDPGAAASKAEETQLKQVKKGLFKPFIDLNAIFTKTGSGQT
jgi:hypothetical protein